MKFNVKYLPNLNLFFVLMNGLGNDCSITTNNVPHSLYNDRKLL